MNKLKEYFSYKKFSRSDCRILFLYNNYLLQKESITTLKYLGHQVLPFNIISDTTKMVETVLKTCLSFKPDCVMSINHNGFDSEGNLANILSELSIPAIIWYVDDFRFIIQNNKNLVNDDTIVFTFEKNHVKLLNSLGYSHSFYLPLASTFNPEKLYSNSGYNYLSSSTTFIGNTFLSTKERWAKDHYDSLLQKLHLDSEFQDPQGNLLSQIEEHQNEFRSIDEFYHFAGYMAAHATQRYRSHFLKKLKTQRLHIFGDPQWRDFDIEAVFHKPANYETETPYIYNHSLINLNLSSRQLETSVNQRVFDVPTAGGFLITDWKDCLHELFDLKKEIVYFKSPEELNELVSFYEKNPSLRDEIISNSKQRVAKEHKLEHRLNMMLSIAENIFS